MSTAAATRRSGLAALAGSGTTMTMGTLASRLTGFVRTVVIATAIGPRIADAYNVANTVPNALYDLLLGGVLSAVIVPLLVQAGHDDTDGGEAYAQRLITLVTATLTAAAVLAVVLAPVIITTYGHRLPHADRELAVTFARFFLPQLLFYGVGATLGAILNVRDSFAAPMWAPVLNNLVVIVSGVTFEVITHATPRAGHLSQVQVLVLAVGTTAGVIAQTVALLPALRRTGFRLRARWDWRGSGLRSAGPFAGWMLTYVVINQLGYLLVVNLATMAARSSGVDSGYSPYSYAFVLFSLPYALVTVTVVTALFPAMSRAGAVGDRATIATSLADGLSLSAVLLVPATMLLVVLGPQLGIVVFDHGNNSLSFARLIGQTLGGFGIGLVPFSAFQMQLRAWLSVRDARTPALVNLAATAVNMAVDLVVYLLLPGRDKIVGLAVGYSLSYLVGAVVFTVLLRRRLAASRRTHVIRTHIRLLLAAAVAAIPTVLVSQVLDRALGDGPGRALVGALVAGVLGIVAFVLLARRMRVPELGQVARLVTRRVRPAH